MSQLAITKDKFEELFAEYSPRLNKIIAHLLKAKSAPELSLSELTSDVDCTYEQFDAGFVLSLERNSRHRETTAILIPIGRSKKYLQPNYRIPAIVGLGAIGYLQFLRGRWQKNIRFIFQDCEVRSAAAILIENNTLRNVVELYSCDCNTMIAANSIAINDKIVVPASEEFQIKIYGNKSNPEADLVLIAAHTVITLSQVSTRKLDPLKPSKILLKSIQSEVTTSGDVSAVTIAGTFYFGDDTVELQKEATVEQTLNAISNAYNVECEYTKLSEEPPVSNNQLCVIKIREAGRSILGSDRIHQFDYMNNDLRFLSGYSRKIPTAVFHLGGTKTVEAGAASFDSQVDTIIKTGVKMISWLALQGGNEVS